jgi:hypothetical protein
MLSTPNSHQPEFSVDLVRGVLTGRIYVPSAWAELPAFHTWYKSIDIIHHRPYQNGNILLLFQAPCQEYYRLSLKFPHSQSYLRARTYRLLRLFFTE